MRWLRWIRQQLARRPLRTTLTVTGVALALVLLVFVESLGAGLDRALSGTEAARTLIVYRQNRYCPQTSFLPEVYAERIAKLDGVRSVLPVKVYLSNCRASLDVVAFQGAPAGDVLTARGLRILEGSAEQFRSERDAALVGRAFAARRGLSVGDLFRFGNINVKVAGIYGSDEPTEEGLVLTHLEYLQRAGPVNRLGTVTQFEVKIDDGSRAEAIAAAIDEAFLTGPEPTDTRPQILFLASATRDLREILRFARWLGIACAVVALVLVGNTVLMSVQERVRELGVLRTLGFRESRIAALILGESVALALAGGALGVAAAWGAVRLWSPSFGVEGVNVAFDASLALAARGVGFAIVVGVVAGLVPAIRSSRAPIVESLRSI